MSMGGRQLRPGLCIDSTADKTTMADRFTKQLTRSLNDQNRAEVMTGNLSPLRTGELL